MNICVEHATPSLFCYKNHSILGLWIDYNLGILILLLLLDSHHLLHNLYTLNIHILPFLLIIHTILTWSIHHTIMVLKMILILKFLPILHLLNLIQYHILYLPFIHQYPLLCRSKEFIFSLFITNWENLVQHNKAKEEQASMITKL